MNERPLTRSTATEYTRVPKDYLVDVQTQDIDQTTQQVDMIQCCNCGRKFASGRIATHERICKNAAEGAHRRGQFRVHTPTAPPKQHY